LITQILHPFQDIARKRLKKNKKNKKEEERESSLGYG